MFFKTVEKIDTRESTIADTSIRMNSENLQLIFLPTYKNFFNKHDIVLSSNSVMTWWADLSHGMSALRIKQKVPLKTYAGICLNTTGKVTFWKILDYSVTENAFKEDNLGGFFKSNLDKTSQFLEGFLVENGYTGGIEMDFLYEAAPWHGFAFISSTSVLIAHLMYMMISKIDSKTVQNGQLSIDDTMFEEIYHLSLHISYYISGGKSTSGASNYVVMQEDNSLPIVHLSQKYRSDDKHTTPEEDGYSEENQAIYKDSLLRFLWKESLKLDELPIDYGVIFTGLEYRFSQIESTIEKIKMDHDDLNSFISHIIDSLPIEGKDKTAFLESLDFDKNKILHKDIDHMSFKILEWFNTLFRNIHSDDATEVFIDNIQKIWLASFSHQRVNKLFFALQYYFHQFQQFENERIAILPFNSGKIGWSLFFVIKKGQSNTTIQKVLDQLKADWHVVWLDYASWRDGYSAVGIRLEQYISEKVYSQYTKAGDVLFTDSFGNSYSQEYDTIVNNEIDCILLDTIWGRIYIKWTKLTSKEIHSQNTTIDMLKLLLENIGQEVSNSRLPVSTYSQNKNEILGKVVLPIKKLAKEHFGEEISLSCSWGITEYYLRLERDNAIRIGIISTLQG